MTSANPDAMIEALAATAKPRARPSRGGRPVTREPEPSSPLAEEIGRRHRELRESKGISLEALAKGIDRTINVIRFHENGQTPMRADDLCRSAGIMGVSAGSLMVTPKNLGR